MTIPYSVHNYLHSKSQKKYNTVLDYISDVLDDIYPQRYEMLKNGKMKFNKNIKTELVIKRNENNFITDVHVYVLTHLSSGGCTSDYDLDILHFTEIDESHSYWNFVKNSEHRYIFTYLNINHNPNFLTAPKYMIELCEQCFDRFTAGGQRYIVKMLSVIDSIKQRSAFKNIIEKNKDMLFLTELNKMVAEIQNGEYVNAVSQVNNIDPNKPLFIQKMNKTNHLNNRL